MILKKYISIYFLLLLLGMGYGVGAQQYLGQQKEELEDSIKFENYTAQIKKYYSVNLDSAKYFAQEKLNFAQDMSNDFREAQSFNDLGLAFDFSGEFDEANRLYNLSLRKFKDIEYQPGIANALLNLGIVQYFKGDYEKSLEYYLSSLEITEELNDRKKLSSLYNNIGTIYKNLFKYDEALKYYSQGRAIDEELKDTIGLAGTLNNMGIAYKMKGDIKNALEYYGKSLELKELVGDESGSASSLSNLSRLYFADGDSEKALDYALKALDIELRFNSTIDILGSYINIGEIYLDDNKLNQANTYLNKGLEIMDQANSLSHNQELYGFLSVLEKKRGNYKKSLEYMEIFNNIKDSVYTEMSTQTVLELKSKYEADKKEQEIESLKRKSELKELEAEKEKAERKAERIAQEESSKRKSMLLWGAVILFLVMVGISIYILKVSKERKRDNLLLSEQKDQIEEKNKEITDSINYAQRIQQALLKAEEHVSEKFPPHFILFKPKDIVSGDFYWAIDKADYLYVAVSDCTGHGVPGAFMSMLGIAYLNEINSREEILTPAQILNELRERVIKELNQTGAVGESKDGMDISLIRINQKTNEIDWAGANNPLYIINKNDLKEIKPNRQPIGYSDSAVPFTNHSFEMEKDSTYYLFSDGYVDQFGGERGKKFKAKQYKYLLAKIVDKPMVDQKTILNDSFETWRGDLEQIDDVCVIGIRV